MVDFKPALSKVSEKNPYKFFTYSSVLILQLLQLILSTFTDEIPNQTFKGFEKVLTGIFILPSIYMAGVSVYRCYSENGLDKTSDKFKAAFALVSIILSALCTTLLFWHTPEIALSKHPSMLSMSFFLGIITNEMFSLPSLYCEYLCIGSFVMLFASEMFLGEEVANFFCVLTGMLAMVYDLAIESNEVSEDTVRSASSVLGNSLATLILLKLVLLILGICFDRTPRFSVKETLTEMLGTLKYIRSKI